MLIRRKKAGEKNNIGVVDVVNTIGDTDYIKDGVIHKHASATSVIITAESDLESLEGYDVGTIAYTAGFNDMWQLDASGNWISIT